MCADFISFPIGYSSSEMKTFLHVWHAQLLVNPALTPSGVVLLRVWAWRSEPHSSFVDFRQWEHSVLPVSDHRRDNSVKASDLRSSVENLRRYIRCIL